VKTSNAVHAPQTTSKTINRYIKSKPSLLFSQNSAGTIRQDTFGLKEIGTRHGRGMSTLSFLLTSKLILVLRETTGCQQPSLKAQALQSKS